MYDFIVEVEPVEKFNPFHDHLGRFTSARGFKTYSANPQSKAGQMAIARSHGGGHGETFNVHRQANHGKGETISQSYQWMKTGRRSGTPKQEKPKTETKPKQQSKQPEKEQPKEQTAGKFTTEEKHKAISHWSDGGYNNLRSVSTGKYDDPKLKREADAIEEFIKESPGYEGALYRGIKVKEPIKFKKNSTTDMQGLSSWSSEEKVAKKFANSMGNQYEYIFIAPKGIKQSAGIEHLSQYPSEKEHIASTNAKFKVTKTQKVKGTKQTLVYVEEIAG